MKRITDPEILERCYTQFPLTDLFSFDISPYVDLVRFEPDEFLFSEGDEPTTLYYLIKGRTKLFVTHEHGRSTLGRFLGEIEMIQSQKAARGVQTVTECICYRIRCRECLEQILADNHFLRYLCVYLGKEAHQNVNHFIQNQAYPLNVRLAEFILISASRGYYREKHTETAEFLGTTYRNLMYALADFVKKGYLKKTKQGYLLADEDALQNLVENAHGRHAGTKQK